jgi:hypothetical protein
MGAARLEADTRPVPRPQSLKLFQNQRVPQPSLTRRYGGRPYVFWRVDLVRGARVIEQSNTTISIRSRSGSGSVRRSAFPNS